MSACRPRVARTLILASSSIYRRALLARLGIAFEWQSPEVEETAAPREAPSALAQRLALAKAAAVAEQRPQAWVIGSDQVCVCDGRRLGKPGTKRRAAATLRWLAGRRAEFHTAVALLPPGAPTLLAIDVTRVVFRRLGAAEIDRYLAAEPALDCAGAFKSEGLGIALCAAIETVDPTALIGLPLIATRRLLAEAGWRIP